MKSQRHRFIRCIVAAVLAAWIQTPAGADDLADYLESRVVEYTLPNGMKFLIFPRSGAPVFSANICFRVGGVDEVPGITGLAHLCEHMAFKGTRTIGVTNYRREKPLLDEIDKVSVPLSLEIAKGDLADRKKIAELRKKLKALQDKARRYVVKDELWDLYLRNGANGLNATTSKDTTRYYVSLPANRLELWVWLESDRMLNRVLREFYSERDVVCEEYRLRVGTRPDGTLYRDLLAAALVAHPARYMTVGWLSDIEAVTRREAEEFFDRYYSPRNTAVALVGDLDVERTEHLLRRYFGRIPARPLPRPIRTREPEQLGERRVKVEWDARPELAIAFHKPSPRHPDEAVFDVIHALLSRGRTSRFYKTIVRDRKLATSVDSWSGPTERYANLFCIWAVPRYPHTSREVEKAIYEVLDTLVTDPPDESELRKVKNNLRADVLKRMQSNSGLASTLGYYQAVFGDWREILRQLERIEKVTPADVSRVARKYFVQRNRTVAEIVPKSSESEGK